MKVLNLDSFAQVKRQLVLNGHKHDIKEVSVQEFIDNLKAAEELEAAGTGAPEKLSKQVEASIDAILKSVPTMPRDELVARPVEVLQAILKFIRGEMDPDAAPKADGEQGNEQPAAANA